MKYAIITFGCRVNQADSLELEEQLRLNGGEPTGAEAAELVVVNTCSVTATADQGARQTIRRITRTNPSAKIVVTGCYASRRPEELASLPGVVRVVGNDGKPKLASLISDDAEPTTAERFGSGSGACGSPIEPGVMGRTAYTLRVQTGCEERCAYCIIPTTRGASRSRPVADVLAEVERIAAAGFKEIALTGVHLGSYGRDLPEASSLLELLRTLAELPRNVLFRISSLEPMDCTTAIVDLVARSDRFAPHFHLPLQHASDAVLQAMRRPYTRMYYQRLVDRLRDKLPHASIGSDIIVGFPGETDEDARINVDYLSSSPLTHLHVFPYSDRPGTSAAALPKKVDGAMVRERAAAVRAVGQHLTERFRLAQVGTVRRALTLADGALAVTDNYLKVRITAGRGRNEWVSIRITGAGETMMSGTVVSS